MNTKQWLSNPFLTTKSPFPLTTKSSLQRFAHEVFRSREAQPHSVASFFRGYTHTRTHQLQHHGDVGISSLFAAFLHNDGATVHIRAGGMISTSPVSFWLRARLPHLAVSKKRVPILERVISATLTTRVSRRDLPEDPSFGGGIAPLFVVEGVRFGAGFEFRRYAFAINNIPMPPRPALASKPSPQSPSFTFCF